MHERLLGRAAWPNPTVCLGLLLKPYSIGHDLRLHRLGNPLAESSLATPQQLSEAVLICHQGWSETVAMPFDLVLRPKMAIWRRRARKTVFLDELTKFIAYRDDGCLEFPASGIVKAGRSEPRIAGSPFLLRLQQFLMLQFRIPESEAWDYPLGLAKCRWGCYWEENGDWTIYNEAEAIYDEKATALMAKIKEEAAA